MKVFWPSWQQRLPQNSIWATDMIWLNISWIFMTSKRPTTKLNISRRKYKRRPNRLQSSLAFFMCNVTWPCTENWPNCKDRSTKLNEHARGSNHMSLVHIDNSMRKVVTHNMRSLQSVLSKLNSLSFQNLYRIGFFLCKMSKQVSVGQMYLFCCNLGPF